jgi:hypothetical protein
MPLEIPIPRPIQREQDRNQRWLTGFQAWIIFGWLAAVGFFSEITGAQTIVSSSALIKERTTWRSCNQYRICYTLQTDNVDLSLVNHRFYTTNLILDIYRLTPEGQHQWLRQLKAKEGQWQANHNQWVLLLDSPHPKEYLFNPETLRR